MEKKCQQCKKEFVINEKDKEFYQKINVPEPKLCPSCRLQRRLTLRNERQLYQDQCDLCRKKIISIYSEEKSYKVFCYDCFYSDKWSAKDFGKDFDWNRPFFEQFKELQLQVPRIYGFCVLNENSEYTNGSGYNKNCYMIFVSDHNEDCLYSYSIFNCRSCMDCLNSYDCELCYETANSVNCFNCQNLSDCSGCNESSYCMDCKGCTACWGCVGLRNQEYHFLNKALSKEQYQERINKITEQDKLEFERLKNVHLFLCSHGLNNENSTGDYINRCKDCKECFDSHDLENCQYVIHGNKAKDTFDGYMIGDNTELSYEILGSLHCTSCKFNYFTTNAYNCEYTDSCSSVKNLFGCVGLKKDEFCILNKQYTENDYYKLREKIIQKMKENGEYGEFYPVGNSPFAYNETAAQEFYPLTKEQILSLGWKWKEMNGINSNVNLPTCKKCHKNFSFVKQELKFYEVQKINKPEYCFNCRHTKRLNKKNPRKLYERNCRECQDKIITTYAPERQEKVLCKTCYNKRVY